MAKKTPPEFPSDWHYENHLENLAREIQGRKDRLLFLEGLPGGTADDKTAAIKQTEDELAAAEAELAHYSKGAKTASKRPKAESVETR